MVHLNRQKWYLVATLVTIGLLAFSANLSADQGKVYSLSINGAISPATADYFERGLDQAIDGHADVLLVHMNTPGGLDKSMRAIIQAILDSPIPVVVYVSPKGARAASAGTYIAYASHVAAMAPATNIGSATPVSIGISAPKPKSQEDQDKEPADAAGSDDVMQRKMINDAEAYILSLAQLRNRNQEWAKLAVREAANLSAEDALAKQVIEIVAYDEQELIKALNGRQLTIDGRQISLDLENPQIVELETDWRTELLMVITDPSIAYLLLLAGVYGLMFEFLHPGGLLPGVVGAICLLVAMYALSLLPINMAGLALLILGIVLMAAEALAPSFGILGIGGGAAFIIGSFMLMDSSLPGYQIAPAIIITASLVSGFIVFFVLSLLLKARRSPLVSGNAELLNHAAIAVEDFDGHGRVMIRGEVWQADCDRPIKNGQTVIVKAIDGLNLQVVEEE